MKTHKDIDSIYRDRFKEAKLSPPEDAWENIISRLPEKKEKRRILPFWSGLVGAAAALALLFVLTFDGNQAESSPFIKTQSSNPVVNIKDKINEASGSFGQEMNRSSSLLQRLAMESKVLPDPQAPKVEVGTAINFSGILEKPEDLDVVQKAYALYDFEVGGEPGNDAVEENRKLDIQIAQEEEIEEDLLAIIENAGQPEVVENTADQKRFRITTKVAPVIFDTFGSGNPADQKFATNQSSTEVSVSYGVSVAYQMSEKFSLRSGISKVDLAYTTAGVSFNDFMGTAAKEGEEIRTTMLTSAVRGELDQRFGFLEIPMEVEYKLLDKKVGINLLGGASALILDKNSVSLNSEASSTDFGEAENLNKLSFTSNIGLGLNYNFSEEIQFSLEPVLKLQLNTFREVEGLNPYYFGIYTGLSYRF